MNIVILLPTKHSPYGMFPFRLVCGRFYKNGIYTLFCKVLFSFNILTVFTLISECLFNILLAFHTHC